LGPWSHHIRKGKTGNGKAYLFPFQVSPVAKNIKVAETKERGESSMHRVQFTLNGANSSRTPTHEPFNKNQEGEKKKGGGRKRPLDFCYIILYAIWPKYINSKLKLFKIFSQKIRPYDYGLTFM